MFGEIKVVAYFVYLNPAWQKMGGLQEHGLQKNNLINPVQSAPAELCLC